MARDFRCPIESPGVPDSPVESPTDRQRPWEIILEPDATVKSVVVVTAYSIWEH